MEAFLVECFLAVTLFLFGFVAAMGYEAFIILRMIIKHKRKINNAVYHNSA